MQLTFARNASISLIMGTALAGGVGRSGLIVEALDPAPLATTSTGDDGSYLLPDITGPVTIRVSDPEGNFVTAESAPVSPPATVDFDLAPVVQLPALGGPLAVLLCLMLGVAGLCLAGLPRNASGG